MRIFIAVLIMLALPITGFAQYYDNSYGHGNNFTNHNYGTSYTTYSNGQSGFTTHNNGSSYTTYSDGSTGFTTHTGNSSFTTYSDGTSSFTTY